MIALDLDETECQVLIDCLDEKILSTEVRKGAYKEYWDATDEAALAYKTKLREKIQKFQDIQEHLGIGRED